jgi:hypothetical protein
LLGDEGSVLWPVWLLGPGVPIDPDPAGAEARITFGDVLPGMVPDVLVVCGISSDEQYLENSQKSFFSRKNYCFTFLPLGVDVLNFFLRH